jgi:hypothetical protein
MRQRWLPILLLLLPATAVAILIIEAQPPPARAARAAEFHRLVGGLGFGPAANLSRCAFGFDPRLCPSCPQQDGPVPAGAVFCPEHGCSILYYPPLETLHHAPVR